MRHRPAPLPSAPLAAVAGPAAMSLGEPPRVAVMLSAWTMVVLPRVPRTAARSSQSETVSLNARDLEAVATFLSCPGNRSNHTYGAMRHGLALATASPLGGFVGKTVRQDLCHASDGEA